MRQVPDKVPLSEFMTQPSQGRGSVTNQPK